MDTKTTARDLDATDSANPSPVGRAHQEHLHSNIFDEASSDDKQGEMPLMSQDYHAHLVEEQA